MLATDPANLGRCDFYVNMTGRRGVVWKILEKRYVNDIDIPDW